MEPIHIQTKSFGLKRSDVDAYITNLVNSGEKRMEELSQEKRSLEEERHKLKKTLEDIQKPSILYEEPDSGPVHTVEQAQKTVALINELANQKIEQMISRAQKRLSEYDNILNSLQKEMDQNRKKIEELLSEASYVIKSNMDNVFPGRSVKNEKKTTENKTDKIISLAEKKSEAEEFLKSKIVENEKDYSKAGNVFVNKIAKVIDLDKRVHIAIMIVEINDLIVANYFLKTYEDETIINSIIEGITDFDYNLHVTRLSYDRIGIVFKHEDEAELVANVAGEILDRIQRGVKVGDLRSDLSANIGIALYPENADSANELVNCAGIALYNSKEKGKGEYEFINDELIAKIAKSQDFRAYLTDAIENNKLEIYYQPQFKAQDEELIGFEALLRWKDEKFGEMPILDIIKMAEKENKISEIGYSIFEKACSFGKRIQDKGEKKIVVSVNFSNLQIAEDDFVEKVGAIMNKVGVEPKYIGLEITESSFMEYNGDNYDKIQSVKDMGVTISIDDFGTGYSNLSYLLKLPVSIVKIDKTFLDDITTSERSANFIDSIINLSHDLGLHVIAEGVETKGQWEMLKEMECDYIQGYYMAHPVPEEKAYMYI